MGCTSRRGQNQNGPLLFEGIRYFQRKMCNRKSFGCVSKPSARRTRVKLRRVNCDFSKAYPPNGDEKRWWDRLKAAMGTTSSEFVNATLVRGGRFDTPEQMAGGLYEGLAS
jgi:hypothetical protein